MTTACKFCSKQISIELVGTDPATGKGKWKRTNEDGTEHKCGNFKPREPIMTKEQGDKIIALLERISGQLAQK